MSSSNNNSIWPVVFIVIVAALVVQALSGGGSSSSSSSSPSVNSGSFEYRYAKERFKQEGYSNSDADTAARAVLKFHEAQKARSR